MILKLVTFCTLAALATPALTEQIAINEGDLQALDADGDGALSKAEFDAFTDFAFEKMDQDGNGALSADEVDDHVIGDAFDMLDDDKNGSVSPAEFKSQMDEDFTAADQDGDGMLK